MDDTIEHNNQDLSVHEEGIHDADSNPCFDEISEDNPDDELEPRVDNIVRATHKADDVMTVNGITLWILRQRKIFWKQTRMTAKLHDDRWNKLPSNWNPAISTKRKGVPETGKTGQEIGRRPRHLLTARQIQNNDLTSDKTWLITAQDGSQWDAMESAFIGIRLRQPNQRTGTTKPHDQNEDDTKDENEQDDNDTLLKLSQLIDIRTSATPKQSQQALVEKAAIRISHDTLILSVIFFLLSTDSGKRLERNTLSIFYLCTERLSLSAHGPRALALGASQRFVYSELTERVIIVIADADGMTGVAAQDDHDQRHDAFSTPHVHFQIRCVLDVASLVPFSYQASGNWQSRVEQSPQTPVRVAQSKRLRCASRVQHTPICAACLRRISLLMRFLCFC